MQAAFRSSRITKQTTTHRMRGNKLDREGTNLHRGHIGLLRLTSLHTQPDAPKASSRDSKASQYNKTKHSTEWRDYSSVSKVRGSHGKAARAGRQKTDWSASSVLVDGSIDSDA